MIQNDYIYIDHKAVHSVGDYCILSYEAPDNGTEFNVALENDFFNRSNHLGFINPEI